MDTAGKVKIRPTKLERHSRSFLRSKRPRDDERWVEWAREFVRLYKRDAWEAHTPPMTREKWCALAQVKPELFPTYRDALSAYDFLVLRHCNPRILGAQPFEVLALCREWMDLEPGAFRTIYQTIYAYEADELKARAPRGVARALEAKQ